MCRMIALTLAWFVCLTSAVAAQTAAIMTEKLNSAPLAFTKNVGQWDERVLYRASAGGATMWFTKEGVTYQFLRRVENSNTFLTPLKRGMNTFAGKLSEDNQSPLETEFGGVPNKESIEQLVLTAKFAGANTNPEVIAAGETEYKCNYFFGNDPAQWHTDVPNYSSITLKDIYPGIDLKYSGDGTGQTAYEFIATPGADISQIRLEYEGVKGTSIDDQGRMIVHTDFGDMIAAIKTPTDGVPSGSASFSQSSKSAVGFKSSDGSQQSLGTLNVGLVYSTFLGGATADMTSGNAIAVDGSGCAYVAGRTYIADFPTQNAYQATIHGPTDAFITKFSASGNSLIYSTYLGCYPFLLDGNDAATGIAVDATGCAYVTGSTDTGSFPTLNPFQEYQGTAGKFDGFVTKLSAEGNALIYSTYLGGSGGDGGGRIAVDGSGCAYVAGYTDSPNFPTLNPYQTNQDTTDVFVTKFSAAGNTLVYSTYLGGSKRDYIGDIDIDGSGCAYVTGYTWSTNFPTLNPYDANRDTTDAFVTKLSAAGNALVYSTYLGGSSIDQGYCIAVDASGCAYVAGQTRSSNFPTQNAYDAGLSSTSDGFVTKFSAAGNSLAYSTYLGGSSTDNASAIAIDDTGCAYVTGSTGSADFPTQNAFDDSYNGSDIYVTMFSEAGTTLVYSTYLGGSTADFINAIAVDDYGYAYVTGWTMSYDFPTTENAFDVSNFGYDAFVTKLTAFYDNDNDDDGVVNDDDNCVAVSNPSQTNSDSDSLGDACDNCPLVANNDQADGDSDGDGNPCDNCPTIANADQLDTDSDGIGDVCDNCPLAANTNQQDTDYDGIGNVCDICPYDPDNDADADGFCANVDNCRYVSNPSQTNTDGDGMGDACDACPLDADNDWDTDGLCANVDNCPLTANADQADANSDGIGDVCQANAEITPPGGGVIVTPIDSVTMTFESVTDAGVTEVVTGPWEEMTSPERFMLIPENSPIFYGIATSATFSGEILLCLTYDETLIRGPEDGLRIWHFRGQLFWEDVTYSQDLENNQICGLVTSLSPFFLAEPKQYECGDANGDDVVDISDVVYLIAYIFSGGAAPDPLEAGDGNCDEVVDISDVVYLIAYIFSGGQAPCAGCK